MATAAVEFEEGLIPEQKPKRADLSLANKAMLIRMRAAAERQLRMVDLLVSAHANGEFNVCEALISPLNTETVCDWTTVDSLRKALRDEKEAWGKDGAL